MKNPQKCMYSTQKINLLQKAVGRVERGGQRKVERGGQKRQKN